MNAEARSVLGSGAMFDAIAPVYDRLNLILSFGLDRRWRRATVDALRLPEEGRVLDLATGTGDLAIEIARSRPRIQVTGLDASPRMLELAGIKIARAQLSDRIALEIGDAVKLPYADDTFEAATIAFGIRNVPDRLAALKELVRVVRPTGRIAILELGDPRSKLIGAAARLYIHAIVPRIGALFARAPEYRYLERSIAAFPPPHEFERLMEEAGMEALKRRSFAFGSAVLFVGEVAADGSRS
jgi:demethylmenaquinone methyltransferase/2-methoxy-6-polyprenyl-1,4-benzoquinol methylase